MLVFSLFSRAAPECSFGLGRKGASFTAVDYTHVIAMHFVYMHTSMRNFDILQMQTFLLLSLLLVELNSREVFYLSGPAVVTQ